LIDSFFIFTTHTSLVVSHSLTFFFFVCVCVRVLFLFFNRIAGVVLLTITHGAWPLGAVAGSQPPEEKEKKQRQHMFRKTFDSLRTQTHTRA
jgi:hypothetical protein